MTDIHPLISAHSDDAAEEMARQLDSCPVCGKPSGRGHLCCWTCFKRDTPNGATPLKYSGLGYRRWLETTLPAPSTT